MANALPAITQYLRACYQADYRAVNLLNFFSNKANHQHLFADEGFLTGTLETLPVATDWAASLSKHIYLHGKEEQLYVHALFLVGRTQLLGKQRSVCAPLYLIPAELHHLEEVYQISLDFSGMVINPAIADVLQELNTSNLPSLADHLNNVLPTGPLNFDHLHAIEQQLANFFPALQLNDLNAFPQAVSEQAFKQSIRKQRAGFVLYPYAGLAMMQKAAGSLGILNELEIMAKGTHFSPILQALFTHEELGVANKKQATTPLPVLLSSNQKAILQAAATQTLTMVNGPPGTGKSFTIAAIAADRLSQGESVLIAAKNPQAVEVIADKLERDFELPGIAIRATRKDYRKHLRRRLKDWLNGLGLKYIYPPDQRKIKIELDTYLAQMATLEDILSQRATRELALGKLMTKDHLSWWERYQRWRLRKALANIAPMWELHQQLEQASHQQQIRAKKYLESLFSAFLTKALRYHRSELQQTWEALKSKTGNQKERYFNRINFQKLLKALPIWLVDSAHIQEVLPLQEGLFDLVIIDEASQSDIASALPLLQRAKRAVIVGDPKQLRHISFLSRERQRGFAQRFQLPEEELSKLEHRLSYRDHSLLDLVSNRIQQQQNILLLDEHFRSLPGIIHFSNTHFYRSQLKIMTAHPHNHAQKCIFLHPTNGQRDASGQNEEEALAILKKIRTIIDAEQALDAGLCQSIGLLSPFRAQVDYLRKIINETLSADELARHRLLIGTPHDFQGEERDLMLISWVVDATTPEGTFRYLAKENVFNVSITRARVAQYLFLSVEPQELPADHLLKHYLQAANTAYTPTLTKAIGNSFSTDAFLREVSEFISKQTDQPLVLENYPIAGLEIDLVVVYQGRTYCIDLIGFPGTYEMALPLERWRMLERLGIPCFALPYSHWVSRTEVSQQALKKFLQVPWCSPEN